MLAPPGTLCESCGYSLADLGTGGACPECGRAIAHSVPGHRPGSPWQLAHSWHGTFKAFVLKPSALFEQIRIESALSNRLSLLNAAIASTIIAIGAVIAGGGSTGSVQFLTGGAIVLMQPMGYANLVFATAPFLVMLIDARLSPPLYRRFYQWPISATAYRAVRGHASFAWIFFALAVAVIAITEPALLSYASRQKNLNLARLSQTLGTAAFLLATLYVAWLHHVGVKACRFAADGTSLPPPKSLKPEGAAVAALTKTDYAAHAARIQDLILRQPVSPPPPPWRRITTAPVGGLTEVGFSADSRFILVISWAGRGVFDCRTGERVGRDDSDDRDTLYGRDQLHAIPIPPITDPEVAIAGLWGGGLSAQTRDGWRTEVVPVPWPMEVALLMPPCRDELLDPCNPNPSFTKLEDQSDIRACGFSPNGCVLVVAASDALTLYVRDAESPPSPTIQHP